MTSCLAWCELGWALLGCDWSAEPVLASHWSRARVGPAAVASVRPGQSPESWGRDTLTLCQWEGTCDIKCDPETRAATWLQSGHVDDSRHVRENQQHYSRRGLQSGGQTYPGIHNTQPVRSQSHFRHIADAHVLSSCISLLSDDVDPTLWSICYLQPGSLSLEFV